MALTSTSPHTHTPSLSILQKKGKRKGLSKAFQDFSDFSKTLDGATLTASGAKTRRGPKKASITQERERLAAVVSHPQFQVNPLRAVQNHLKHTLASATATPPSAIALKSKKKADAVTEAQKKQMRYRKKMEKQTDKQMDVA